MHLVLKMRSSLVPWLIILASYHVSALVTYQRKFDFLPIRSEAFFGPASTGNCSETLRIYNDCWNEPIQDPDCIAGAVYNHQECILGNSTENVKAAMSSALVLLGLAPILLQSAGPSVNELGLMSMQRPGLAMLLALGTAAIFPSRMFGYRDESFGALQDIVKEDSLIPDFLKDRLWNNSPLQVFVCVVQYLVAIASIGNTLYTGYQLGVASVNDFDCADSMLPLIWTFIPLVMHLFTAWLFWHRRQRIERETHCQTTGSSMIRKSLTTCFAQDAPHVPESKPSLLSSVLYWIISVFGLVHGVFGVLVFSSLLFVAVGDAAVMLLRYFASTIACQAVIAFEISGMRAATERENNNASQNKAGMARINQP